MRSTLFFAFANSSSAPLPTLSKEDDALYAALSPRALQLHFMIHRDSHANREKIARDLLLFRDFIEIFHFSGHAGRDFLETNGGDAQSEGIAYLLGQCKQLQLVVLNGCSTKGQVSKLLDAGIPAVIATDAAVEDERATLFSIGLYEALAQGKSLEEAFEFAKGKILMYDNKLEFRGLDFDFINSNDNSPCWGLFIQKEKAKYYKLPDQTSVKKMEEYHPNVYLQNTIWHALKEESPAIKRFVYLKEEQGDQISGSEIRIQILNNLPAPIAEHLRKLLVPVVDENQGIGYDSISEYRARQITRTYDFTLRFLAFTFLAQLWEMLLDANANQPKIQLSFEQKNLVREFLKMDGAAQQQFDYIGLLQQLHQLLDDNQVTFYVAEFSKFKQLLGTNEIFKEAIAFLEHLRSKLYNNSIQSFEISNLCIRGEESLAVFFSELGFLARYVLISIQHIDVAKFRHKRKAYFIHQVVLLRNLLGQLDRTEEQLDAFLDNRSVLLRRIDKDNQNFLNLSPFVVDENAFEENTDVAKIFFFNHFDKLEDAYVFSYVNKPEDKIFVRQTIKRIGILKIQLDAFLSFFDTNAITPN
jgi:hypothetical protein